VTDFALWETALGTCGLVWGENGIRAIRLPEKGAEGTRARIRRDFPGAVEAEPPREVRSAMEAVAAHLRGERADLGAVRLDLGGLPPFHREVYLAARGIATGTTVTYGQLARSAGSPGAARAVGQALARNPFPVVIPCHRVLSADGLGGFTAAGGLETKRILLRREGVGLPD
jgi:methylated-DNA-[protein]-cysteine S-methyltransferase